MAGGAHEEGMECWFWPWSQNEQYFWWRNTRMDHNALGMVTVTPRKVNSKEAWEANRWSASPLKLWRASVQSMEHPATVAT